MKAGAKGRKKGSGRPPGFLVDWLLNAGRFDDALSRQPCGVGSHGDRRAARNYFKTLPGTTALLDLEANAEPGAASEPENTRRVGDFRFARWPLPCAIAMKDRLAQTHPECHMSWYPGTEWLVPSASVRHVGDMWKAGSPRALAPRYHLGCIVPESMCDSGRGVSTRGSLVIGWLSV